MRFLGLPLLLVACGGTEPEGPADGTVARVDDALVAAFDDRDDTVHVIVNLRESDAMTKDGAARRGYVRSVQEAVLARAGTNFTPSRRFGGVAAFAGRVSRGALERLRHDPDVAFVQLDGEGHGALREAVPAIGADRVKSSLGLTGEGVRVAVLDTGVVTTHADLRDAVVAQHCFTQFDCPPLRGFEGTSAEDDHGHGSNVSGIVASRGAVAPAGFAPGAELVAVKINDYNDSGLISDWVAGLDWVYENLATTGVKVVNLSICSTALYRTAAECDAAQPALARAVRNLTDAGVVVFAASGNVGSSTSMAAPACNTGVIAVGAVYDANVGRQPSTGATYGALGGASFANCADATTAFDQITCFTNSNARLDLVAPGAPMLSDSLGGRTETYWGTSQASPVAAGVAALMLQCDPTLTPLEIRQAMTSTGVQRVDPKNGLSFPSLRAYEAVTAVCDGDAGAPGAGGAGTGGAGAGGVGAGGVPFPPGAGGFAGAPASGGATTTGAGGASAPPVTGGAPGGPPAVGGAAGGIAAPGGFPAFSAGGSGASFGTGSGQGADDAGCTCGLASRTDGSGTWLAGVSTAALAVLRLRTRRRPNRSEARVSR